MTDLDYEVIIDVLLEKIDAVLIVGFVRISGLHTQLIEALEEFLC